jgi:hypothetical protein
MLSIFRQKFSLREGAPQPPFEVVTLLCALVAEDTLLPFLRYMQALHGSICTTTATAADETTVTQPACPSPAFLPSTGVHASVPRKYFHVR